MTLGLCLTFVIALVWVVTAFASRPGQTTQPTTTDRRAAQLRSCPDRITAADVTTLLSGSLGPVAVARVTGTASARRISPRTLWRWADRFGADRLVLAIDAEVSQKSMQRHLDQGTTPDWGAMAVFADFNNDDAPAGMPLEELLDLDAVPALADLSFPPDLDDWTTAGLAVAPEQLDLSQFGDLPPIFGPGLTGTASGWDSVRDDEDNDWPMAA